MKNYFTLDGIIEVTEGDYKGKFFVVDIIDDSHPTIQTVTCSSLSGLGLELKFDQLCARQIGILTVRTIVGDGTTRLKTALKDCVENGVCGGDGICVDTREAIDKILNISNNV